MVKNCEDRQERRDSRRRTLERSRDRRRKYVRLNRFVLMGDQNTNTFRMEPDAEVNLRMVEYDVYYDLDGVYESHDERPGTEPSLECASLHEEHSAEEEYFRDALVDDVYSY